MKVNLHPKRKQATEATEPTLSAVSYTHLTPPTKASV